MTAATFKTNFNPNPIQRSFIESKAPADLFSSRAGEGKSTGLAWAIFSHTRHNPGAAWAVIRDTYENLQKSTQKTFFEWFPPGIYGTYHATKKEFTWAEGVAQGTVSFVGIDDPTDASKLLSWELAGIAMDEPAPAVGSAGIDEMVFDLGMTRLRQPNMNWYAMKLATNNPDESHWTYRKFVQPGIEGFRIHQPVAPENVQNLPANYYENMRKTLAHRPDLIRRFVDGEFGFQSEGKAVTPQWNDKLHLATGLVAIPRLPIHVLWDFGLNPTAIITQRTPLGYWMILDAFVGEGIGVTELIEDAVKPLLADRYRGNPMVHIGDPAGENREQSSSLNRATLVIKRELGGVWRAGPQKWTPRRDAVHRVLSHTLSGRGVVQVDRHRAAEVWYALRGGWHYHVARTGLVSALPKKNIHSHPGDAFSYGAAVLFPVGKINGPGLVLPTPEEARYFGAGGRSSGQPLPEPPSETDWRIGKSYGTIPAHGDVLPDGGEF